MNAVIDSLGDVATVLAAVAEHAQHWMHALAAQVPALPADDAVPAPAHTGSSVERDLALFGAFALGGFLGFVLGYLKAAIRFMGPPGPFTGFGAPRTPNALPTPRRNAGEPPRMDRGGTRGVGQMPQGVNQFGELD
jgi:hypothetical protein